MLDIILHFALWSVTLVVSWTIGSLVLSIAGTGLISAAVGIWILVEKIKHGMGG